MHRMLSRRLAREFQRPCLRSNVAYKCHGRRWQTSQAPKTYFQPPPPPAHPSPQQPKRRWRILQAVLIGSSCFALGLLVNVTVQTEELLEQLPYDGMHPGHDRLLGDSDFVNFALRARESYLVGPKAVSHTSSLPSNFPGEDTESAGQLQVVDDASKDWSWHLICDGHNGFFLSHWLSDMLPSVFVAYLEKEHGRNRSYSANDGIIARVIRNAFVILDDLVLAVPTQIGPGEPSREHISAMMTAMQGSCALMTLFDPISESLWIANTGDSRAVLGRWNRSAGRYEAAAATVDQTGFNPEEVKRLQQEHPGESPIDPKTGRVLGLAVTRAFGDAAWKWPYKITETFHKQFWGLPPRPKEMCRTPPYVTAEPVVSELRVETSDHPDFLIMASDGLWDKMSSEDAVACVDLWLRTNAPASQPEIDMNPDKRKPDGPRSDKKESAESFVYPGARLDDDTYYNENEKAKHWHVTPKHFVNEDKNCGTHLIRNALGGTRRNMVACVMSLAPPFSRAVRDDITVTVMFFGADDASNYRKVHGVLGPMDPTHLTPVELQDVKGFSSR